MKTINPTQELVTVGEGIVTVKGKPVIFVDEVEQALDESGSQPVDLVVLNPLGEHRFGDIQNYIDDASIGSWYARRPREFPHEMMRRHELNHHHFFHELHWMFPEPRLPMPTISWRKKPENFTKHALTELTPEARNARTRDRLLANTRLLQEALAKRT